MEYSIPQYLVHYTRLSIKYETFWYVILSLAHNMKCLMHYTTVNIKYEIRSFSMRRIKWPLTVGVGRNETYGFLGVTHQWSPIRLFNWLAGRWKNSRKVLRMGLNWLAECVSQLFRCFKIPSGCRLFFWRSQAPLAAIFVLSNRILCRPVIWRSATAGYVWLNPEHLSYSLNRASTLPSSSNDLTFPQDHGI